MKYRQTTPYLLLALVVIVLAGCPGAGPGPQIEVGDTGAVKDLVIDMPDQARSRDTFAKMFVKGKVPDEKSRVKYNKYAFYIKGEPTIEGDKASITIDVVDPDDYDSTEPIATITWVAVKEGDAWKLEDAPVSDLP